MIPDASTGEGSTTGAPRLDLPSWPDLPADSSSGAGSTSAPTTGALDGPESTGGTSGESTSAGPGGSTGDSSGSTADASTSTSGTSTGGSSSTGEDSSTGEAPAVCGDGTCSASELEVECYAPGWCYGDCAEDPACLSDCPCSPEAEAAQGFCAGGIVCSATAPGGYCDPNGDGAFLDGDLTRGFLEWKAKCA